ncbi:MAG TPA: NADH-ubiquinone oxidoreductase-F iron-sulfur binding region domain-containing protein, partial [Verrucomicrobiae bacterium]|nr:NADH-ubiquinone oxidoreductase-F iron-sulfur binding region domain-containing protein [Verrucomicrobiae bacterium]
MSAPGTSQSADWSIPKGNNRPEVESFYHLSSCPLAGKACQGTACFVARHLNQKRWVDATSREPRVYCLGQCFAAPAMSNGHARPHVEVRSRQGIVLGRLANGGARSLNRYTAKGGYQALEHALEKPREGIIKTIETSGLRGRGGAGFPTGRKWRAVAQQPQGEKCIIANADEGDAGAYIDRFLMEDDPFSLIEGMTLAGYAIGASKGWIYLRNEYPQAEVNLREALKEARKADLLGQRVLGHNFTFDIEVFLGHGSYVCGEETALIRSLEGRRPEVMARPPYATESGLLGHPTLMNNVETLVNVPWIVQHSGEAYRQLGYSQSRGTKAVSLNSLFQRPGLYEVEFGVSVRHIIEDLGGGLRAGSLQGVIIGGPLAGIIPPRLLDTPFGFEELHAIGASVGHGGVVAFDEHTSIAELVHHIFSFGTYESCGKCTPCRLGSRRIEEIFRRVVT